VIKMERGKISPDNILSGRMDHKIHRQIIHKFEVKYRAMILSSLIRDWYTSGVQFYIRSTRSTAILVLLSVCNSYTLTKDVLYESKLKLIS
jgi:hypothetical protein